MGALLLALVAAMTPFVAGPDIAYAQQSADTTLSALTVVGQPTENPTPPSPPTGVSAYSTLDPTLQSDPTADSWTTEYDVRIPFVQTAVLVTVRPTTHGIQDPNTNTNDDAIVMVNGQRATIAAELDGDFTRTVSVAAGATTPITIAVTAQSRNSTQTYTVNVYRESSQTRDDNANLGSLSLSGTSLSPGFSGGTIGYKARIQSGSTTLAYTLSDRRGGASAAITAPAACTGGATTNCTDGKKVYLGDQATTTTVTVVVTPESGTDGNKTYTIEVYRIRDSRETNADLALSSATDPGLTITPVGTDSAFVAPSVAGDVYDADSAVKTSSNLRVNNETTHVTVAANAADVGATTAISPSDSRFGTGVGNEGHQVVLTAGRETPITVTVTAEDTAVRKTYTVTVYRERATRLQDNNLTSLSLSAGMLSPAFDRDTTGYNAQVASTVKEVTVNYTASDTAGGSSVGITAFQVAADGVADGSEITTTAVDGKKVTLEAEGSSTRIKVVVTPECGSATDEECVGNTGPKTYTITVYRLRAAPSAGATLATLAVSPGTLVPAFDAADVKSKYNVDVNNNVAVITVTATPANAASGATIAISPNGGSNVPLMEGAETTITMTVTAEDRTTTNTFEVVVYRYNATRSENADLSALSLSAGTLSPAFMSDRVEYTARVASDVTKVTVSRTLSDNAGGASSAVATSIDNDCSTDGDNTAVTGDVNLNSAGNNTFICVTATAEDGSTNKIYFITVYRERANLNTDAGLATFDITEATGSVNITTGASSTTTTDHVLSLLTDKTPDVAYRVRQVTVTAMANDTGAIVTIMPADADVGTVGHQVDLTAGAETMISAMVQPEDPTAPAESHTAMVYRKNIPGSESDDATLSSLMLSGVRLMYKDNNDMDMSGFMPDVMTYTGNAAMEQITVTAMANHLGAQSGITITPGDHNMDMDGWQVDLAAAVGDTTSITVQVRPESVASTAVTTSNDCSVAAAIRHADIECYTVTVTRVAEQALRDEAALRTMYDTNGTDGIQIDEAVRAVQDYAAGTLRIEEVVIVVRLYATGG